VQHPRDQAHGLPCTVNVRVCFRIERDKVNSPVDVADVDDLVVVCLGWTGDPDHRGCPFCFPAVDCLRFLHQPELKVW
jgi:hypothetical protein